MKATKETEEKFRRIFHDSPIGIELYDRKGNLLEVNKASLKIFGISDIKNVLNYNFFEDPNTPETIKENLGLGKISRFEKIYDFDQIKKSNLYETSKSGTIFHDVLVSPLFLKGDKGYSHFLVQVQDITLKKLSEEKSKESEERFRRMADSIYDGLTIIEKGKIIYINDQACEIAGYPRKELIRMSGIDLAAPEEKERVKKFMEDIKNKIIPLKEFEYWILRKDGTRRYIHNRYSLAKEENSTNRFVVTTDITERKLAEQKLKESEEKFRILYENIAGGTVIVGEDYIIKDVNNRTCEITGYTKDELIGQFCDIVCPKGSESNSCPIWEEGKEDFMGMDTFIKCKDGRKNPILKNAKKIIHDGTIYVLENFQDIFERNLAEQKLKESEIKYRLAYNRAEFYKDLFAHDMNNILHNILSSSELYSLCRKFPEKLDKGEDLLSIIEAQAKRGANLISNVQKLSKLEQTGFQTEKIDICEQLEKAIKFVKESFQDRTINLLIEAKYENLYVRANELLLDVFENILLNSVKYNHNNSVFINILISKEIKDEKNYLKLQFLDNGIGISDSRKETIFQRDYSRDRNLKGMGIGLSLVKNIIYSYNGYITVEDKERGDHSKGSNFIIYIPEAE